MKIKSLLIAIITLISLNSFSQVKKGKIFLGVNSNLNFSSTSNETTITDGNNFANYKSPSSNHFVINPKVGYIITDNFLGGLDLSLSFSNTKNEYDNDISSNSYVISPFLRYYFLKEKFKPFVNAQFGLGGISTDYYDIYIYDPAQGFPVNGGKQVIDSSIQSYSLGAGLAYFINDYIAIEFNINYINEEFTTKNNSYKSVQVTKGVQSLVGFSVML